LRGPRGRTSRSRASSRQHHHAGCSRATARGSACPRHRTGRRWLSQWPMQVGKACQKTSIECWAPAPNCRAARRSARPCPGAGRMGATD
jgi:hypothetical protein